MSVNGWPPGPIIYELNTSLWLTEWRRVGGESFHLGNLPAEVWKDFERKDIDAIWFMGVWERSEEGRRLLWQIPEVKEANPGGIQPSPYCIKNYSVAEEFGGGEGLRKARMSLEQKGLRLILDFVPNHTAPDHPWTTTNPEFYIPGDSLNEGSAILCGSRLLAKGRDPFFPPWPDVVQLNAFHDGYREKAIHVLLDMASQCDGVRCDMAMLLLNEVFENTWGNRAGKRPREEFWSRAIENVKEKYPSFLFLAEVYWGKEEELLKLGFDYCYDKVLYDILRQGEVPALRDHLSKKRDFQDHLLRFLENHDEERAAFVFPFEQLKAANVITATLPGALMFYQGQWEGKRRKIPVYASEAPREEPDKEMEAFYRWLSSLKKSEVLRKGRWELLPPFQVWSDNTSGENLMAWLWSYGPGRLLVIVNYSARPAQGRLSLPSLGSGPLDLINLQDLATGEFYIRKAGELISPGLYVDLPAWGYHLFSFSVP